MEQQKFSIVLNETTYYLKPRFKMIGDLTINHTQNSLPPSGALSLSGITKITFPFSSGTPSVNTSDTNGPIWRGGKFTTPKTNFPRNSSFVYKSTSRAEDCFTPISRPKSIVSLYAGFRASGKSSTST